MNNDGKKNGNGDGPKINGGTGGDLEGDSTTLGFLLFQFLNMAVNEMRLTREQISLFCMGLEQMVDHLGYTKEKFTLELAEQAIDKEIALRKRIQQLKRCRRASHAAAESNYDVFLLPPLRPELMN